MAEIFIGYVLDWKGPEVLSFHLTEEEARQHQAANQYLLVKNFDFPGDPRLNPEAALDFIQASLWKDFCEST